MSDAEDAAVDQGLEDAPDSVSSEVESDDVAASKPVLEPEEIEALMASMAPGETIDALFANLPPIKQPESVESYAFEQGDEEGPARYPLFVNLQERMTEALQEQWSDVFKRDVGISLQDMSQKTYSDIIADEVPKVFFAYVVEGYGRMMLAFDLPLIVAHVDAMLGGNGEAYSEKIESLSPVERRLSNRIASSLEKHLEDAWKPVTFLDFELFKLDTDPQFLSVASSQDPCFSMQFDIQLDEDVKGGFALHYPRSFLEPMLETLRSTMNDDPIAVDDEWLVALQDSLSTVPVTLRLELGQCVMDIGQFLNLSEGDYLPLKVSEADPATLWVGEMPMFKAQAGSQDGMLAAELISGGAS